MHLRCHACCLQWLQVVSADYGTESSRQRQRAEERVSRGRARGSCGETMSKIRGQRASEHNWFGGACVVEGGQTRARARLAACGWRSFPQPTRGTARGSVPWSGRSRAMSRWLAWARPGRTRNVTSTGTGRASRCGACAPGHQGRTVSGLFSGQRGGHAPA
jgi:hypothetical protein